MWTGGQVVETTTTVNPRLWKLEKENNDLRDRVQELEGLLKEAVANIEYNMKIKKELRALIMKMIDPK